MEYCAKRCVRSGTRSLMISKFANGYIVAGVAKSEINRVQASQFTPSMFIEQDPQTPSRHERRNVSVESTLFLIQNRASRTIGPQSSRSTWKVSRRGFPPESGS